jgi:hypothetical protein
MRRVARVSGILIILLAGSSSVAPVVAAAQIRQAFHIEVLFPPEVVRFADATSLVYELHVTNFAHTPLLLNRLEILDAETGVVIRDMDRAALETVTAEVSGLRRETERRKIAPGMRGVVYLDVPVAKAPRRVRHRINFDVLNGANVEHARAEGGETLVSARSAPILGPPLRGGPWVAVYDPQLERGHRRVVYAINGRARIPGRFAVDWMKGSTTGISTPDGGSAQVRADGFGSEVLAVADAVVAATRDDFSDTSQGVPPALEDATGNYIALDLGDGVYAFYEHLKAGILVGPGDRVRRGQVIARLGATGQASRPHLHFHLSDANSPLAAEGLPFALANVAVLGAYESIDAFLNGGQWVELPAPRQVESRFSSPNMVVVFPPVH